MANWDVKLDGNKAFDQMTDLAGKVWNTFSEPSTAVVVELMNESAYNLRHVGNFRWQGNFMQPEDDLAAGYGRVWGMESKGMDGSFGAVIYQLWNGKAALDVYLVIGNLIFWDGAQPCYTAMLTQTDQYAEGKPKTLDLLNEGKSAAWTQDYKDFGGVNLSVKVDIWRQEITATAENFRIQITPLP